MFAAVVHGNSMTKGVVAVLWYGLILFGSALGESHYEISLQKGTAEELVEPAESEFKFTRILFSKPDSGTIPVLKENTILMRRRFNEKTYAYYSGKLEGNGFSVKSEFPIEPGKGIEWYLQKKFYLSPDDHYSNDIATVYFSQASVYVENAQRLWYVDKGWEMLEVAGDSRLVLVTTQPESAAVMSDGIVLGYTPLKIDLGRREFRSITLAKEGFYRYELFLSRENDVEGVRKVALSKTIDAPRGTYIDPESYASGSSVGVNSIRVLIESSEKELEELARKRVDDRAILEESYGEFRRQELFEDTEIYRERYKLFGEIKKEALDNSDKKITFQEHLLREKILLLHEYRKQIEDRLYQTFFPASILSVGNYINDGGYFRVSIVGNNQGHCFVIQGILSIPASKAATFSFATDESMVKVSYRAKAVRQAVDGVWVLKYEYSSFSLLFRGAEYPITITPVDDLSATAPVSSNMNGGKK